MSLTAPTSSAAGSVAALPAAATDSAHATHRATARAGVLFGIAAYGAWGLFPVYFKALTTVRADEILCHRVIWSLAFLVILMLIRGRWDALRQAVRSRTTLLTLGATTLLIAGNWLVFIWSVVTGQLLESSLGYYINPLVNMLLGFIFLRERLRGWQLVSVALAAIGVGYLTLTHGKPPAIALFLAISFAFYGLLRKRAHVDAQTGLTIETALLAPLAIAYLGYLMLTGHASFGATSRQLDGLLMAAGVVTAVPLMFFAASARRLRLTTLGFIQYLSPTGQFLLAVLVYGEPMHTANLVAFACIWTALAIYTVDSVLRYRNMPLPSGESPLPE